MNLLGATDWILFLATLWALVLLGLFLLLPRILGQHGSSLTEAQSLLLVVAVALIARLTPNFLLPMGAGYDIESYELVGNQVLSGNDVYTSPETTNRHPYLPFQMYWMGFAMALANAMRVPFVKVVRLAPIGADVGIALLLFKSLLRRFSPRQALLGGMSYAVNPIPVFVSAYHGQFDALPALFILLSWYTVAFSPSVFCHLARAGAWLGLGILDKSWPVLALPNLVWAVRGNKRKALFLASVGAVPLLGIGAYLLLFDAPAASMLNRALGYQWGVGAWGYAYLLRMLSVLVPVLDGPIRWVVRNGRYLTLAALGLAWLIRARKEASEAGILTVLVAFFAATHAFSIQYLMWLVPFAVLNQERKWLIRYTLAALSYYLLTYMTLVLSMRVTRWMPWPQADWFIIRPSELPTWLVTVAWLRERLSGAVKAGRVHPLRLG
jgi:hypothetical protein